MSRLTVQKWDIGEVKRLKMKQLFQYNLFGVGFFLLSFYYVKIEGSIDVFFIICCIGLWGFLVHSLYVLKTGEIIGTKTMKRVYAFDKDSRGHRSWKRKQVIEVIIIGVVSLMITIGLWMFPSNSESLQIYNLFPMIGAWGGLNIGEVIRMTNL